MNQVFSITQSSTNTLTKLTISRRTNILSNVPNVVNDARVNFPNFWLIIILLPDHEIILKQKLPRKARIEPYAIANSHSQPILSLWIVRGLFSSINLYIYPRFWADVRSLIPLSQASCAHCDLMISGPYRFWSYW